MSRDLSYVLDAVQRATDHGRQFHQVIVLPEPPVRYRRNRGRQPHCIIICAEMDDAQSIAADLRGAVTRDNLRAFPGVKVRWVQSFQWHAQISMAMVAVWAREPDGES